MRRVQGAALAVSGLAIALLAAAGPGTRLGLWHFRTGLRMLSWAAYAGMAGAALALAALVAGLLARRRVRPGAPAGRPLAAPALALLLAAPAVLVPVLGLRRARALPPIHDVTTDLEDPPAFVAVLPRRAGAPNPAAYGGDRVAAQQRAGYPDLGPVRLTVPPAAAYPRALAAARAMGWELVAADSAAGRIEATATTRWFGFQDDVVVRLRPEGAGTRVDVRSVSRVGASDVGANAERIRAYLARLRG